VESPDGFCSKVSVRAGGLSYTDEGYGAAQQLALKLIVEMAKAVDPAVTSAFR
jgi:hypothetical protein